MEKDALVRALAQVIPQELCKDLADEFIQLRQDVATNMLGRSSSGKLIETIVQIMDFLENGKYDAHPNVEGYLKNVESRTSSLDDGLRICGARIARGMYALRSKRNILHKGGVDSNTYDLLYLLHGAQWLLAELLRNVCGLTMQEAGQLINLVNAPVGGLVEDLAGRRLVLLNDLEAPEEVLILLHSQYGTVVKLLAIFNSLNRRTEKQVRNALLSLWRRKMIDGTAKDGYQLTSKGFGVASDLIHEATKNR
jgi:hypothetical protein